MHPHVSLIIPVHNAGPLLEHCLASAAAQTEPELEIICIDDASTDASGAMLDAMAQADSRFMVVHRAANGGESAARNQGVAMARGEYLAFLDHDDMLEPDACRLLYQAARNADADIAKGRVRVRDYNGEFQSRPEENDRRIAEVSKFYFLDDWWSAIYRANMIQNSIFFAENYPLGADLLFLYTALSKANRVVCINDIVYNYLRHEDSGYSPLFTTEKAFSLTEMTHRIMQSINADAIAASDKRGYMVQAWHCFTRCLHCISRCTNTESRIRSCEYMFKMMDMHQFPNEFKQELQTQFPQLVPVLYHADRGDFVKIACEEEQKFKNLLSMLTKLRSLVSQRVKQGRRPSPTSGTAYFPGRLPQMLPKQ